MNQIPFTTSKGDFLAVKVPKDAKGFELEIYPVGNWYWLEYDVKDKDEESKFFGEYITTGVALPAGDWRIFKKLGHITESKAQEVVQNFDMYSLPRQKKSYQNYQSDNETFDTALESWKSLMNRHGITNNHIILKK